MLRIRPLILLALLVTVSISCKQETKLGAEENAITANSFDIAKRRHEENMKFIVDSLLGGAKIVIGEKEIDSCGYVSHSNEKLKREFRGILQIESVDGIKPADSVVVMPPFSSCDFGETYYFINSKLPRITTDSKCCHPQNLFVVGDIDEDGVDEIGLYYSSCASRYKSILYYSLKNGAWKEIGIAGMDVLTADPDTLVFKDLVRKIKKNEFSICSFGDGITEWDTIKM